MEELKKMLCDELEDITAKGQLTAGDLDTVDKLTHSIKSIETIMAMGGYSNTYPYSYGRNSYDNSYDGNNSYAQRRDRMGRYSRENRGGNRGGRGGYSRGYSYGKDEMMQELRELMEDAETEQERNAISRCINEME